MRLVTMVVFLLWASPVGAQSRYKPTCDESNPKLCSQPLLKGEAAPFAGQLLTPELAILQAQKAHGCDLEKDHAVKHAQALAEAKLNLTERLGAVDLAACEEKAAVLEKAMTALHRDLEKASERSWTESPILWFSVGVLTTSAALYGGFQILRVSAR